ncbi:MAG: PilT/PilU family type 4a pilus ATPase [Pseudomonadales bacterium]|nr:PilT/PilU family type 4a pilus ATPase [Pseudomonadales bacterium]
MIKDAITLFEDYLAACVEMGASDLHLSAHCPATFRVNGELVSEGGEDGEGISGKEMDTTVLQADQTKEIIQTITSDKQWDVFVQQRSLDMSYSLYTGDRFRVNCYFQRGSAALAVRWLDGTFQSMESLRLPQQLTTISQLKDGLVLVTGATGSGKSTTLASILNRINETRSCHILTIEDPIEFVYINNKSMVHQRELHTDVNSFADAVRAAMREDPDVILVGEMRDKETMKAAITAAETGHLVFSTLHTGDAVGVIDRLVGSFPGEEQDGIRQQLSMVLRSVVTQQLVPDAHNRGRLPVNEVLMVTPAIANLIRNHRPEQIKSMMESGRASGMQTMELALAQRVHEKLLDVEVARKLARNEHAFNEMLRMWSQQKTNQMAV